MNESMNVRSNRSATDSLARVAADDKTAFRTPVFSGGPGGGKSTLANHFATAYGLPVVSAGGILRDLHKDLCPDGKVSFEEWYGSQNGTELRELNDRIKVIFESGKAIGESRFVGHLDADKCVFIYVDADPVIKATRLSNDPKRVDYFGKPIDEIVGILRKREADELRVAGELAELYGLGAGYDYRNPKNYHVTLNSGLVSIEFEVSVVSGLLRDRTHIR